MARATETKGPVGEGVAETPSLPGIAELFDAQQKTALLLEQTGRGLATILQQQDALTARLALLEQEKVALAEAMMGLGAILQKVVAARGL